MSPLYPDNAAIGYARTATTDGQRSPHDGTQHDANATAATPAATHDDGPAPTTAQTCRTERQEYSARSIRCILNIKSDE